MPLDRGRRQGRGRGSRPGSRGPGRGRRGTPAPGLGGGGHQGGTYLPQGSGRPVPPPSQGIKLRHLIHALSQPNMVAQATAGQRRRPGRRAAAGGGDLDASAGFPCAPGCGRFPTTSALVACRLPRSKAAQGLFLYKSILHGLPTVK